MLIHSLQRTAQGPSWTVVGKLYPTQQVTAHKDHDTHCHTKLRAAADSSIACMAGDQLEPLLFPNTRRGFNERRIRVLVKEVQVLSSSS